MSANNTHKNIDLKKNVKLNEICRNHPTEFFEYEVECIEDTEQGDMSTQCLRMQKSRLIDLKQKLER